MLTQPTVDKLRQMRLVGMADGFSAQLRLSDYHSLCFEERFGLLVDQEWTYRQDRRLARLLKEANLRLSASLEDIDYQQPRGLDRALMATLATGQWLNNHQNVIITGPTGVGKTFIACALAHGAIRLGFSARYYRLSRLLSDLVLARADGSYQKLATSLAKTDLLVLDEWGTVPFSAADCRELLEVVDDRSQRRSTIVASQLPIDTWHATFADPTIADAVMDRLVHNAYKIAMRGESMRKVLAVAMSKE